MAICILIYVMLLGCFFINRKTALFKKIRKEEKKIIFVVIFFGNLVATILFLVGSISDSSANEIKRNVYGGGSRIEEYEATIEGEIESEKIAIEVQEQEYTAEEIQDIFLEIKQKLEKIVLGENESCDRVEKRLNLVDSLEDYPVNIRWEMDHYDVMTLDGEIIQDKTVDSGTSVQLRGILSYGSEETIYLMNVMVYPETKEGEGKWTELLRESVDEQEENTREDETFTLPDTVGGRKVIWNKTKDMRGYYILGFSVVVCVLLIWKNRQDIKEKRQKATEQMLRDYPNIISKFTLLLSTGMTVKAVWTKIVQSYEEEKDEKRYAYEEMRITYHEMQSGVAEAEAYERFGRRCRVVPYMKFAALLSQNLKKGGKGLCELLKMESIQAFENRKSIARRAGEEASTKLLIPMFGMLAVVMVIVIIPAFLSIQI